MTLSSFHYSLCFLGLDSPQNCYLHSDHNKGFCGFCIIPDNTANSDIIIKTFMNIFWKAVYFCICSRPAWEPFDRLNKPTSTPLLSLFKTKWSTGNDVEVTVRCTSDQPVWFCCGLPGTWTNSETPGWMRAQTFSWGTEQLWAKARNRL